jgi:hypothetical protein
MTASELMIGDKFTTLDDTIKIVKNKDKIFVICNYVPNNGYTVYVPKESEVDIYIEDKTFTSNPDYKRNMFK